MDDGVAATFYYKGVNKMSFLSKVKASKRIVARSPDEHGEFDSLLDKEDFNKEDVEEVSKLLGVDEDNDEYNALADIEVTLTGTLTSEESEEGSFPIIEDVTYHAKAANGKMVDVEKFITKAAKKRIYKNFMDHLSEQAYDRKQFNRFGSI